MKRKKEQIRQTYSFKQRAKNSEQARPRCCTYKIWDRVMRDKIKLVSSAGTGHYYTTTKNKKTMPDKMEIKKFDPVVRKYVMYTEKKIK